MFFCVRSKLGEDATRIGPGFGSSEPGTTPSVFSMPRIGTIVGLD